MLNEKKSQNEVHAQSQKIQSNEGLAHLISSRKQRFVDELKVDPPEPPWEKHPGYSRNHRFWRTGAGSRYLMEYIWPFNRYSTKEARKLYRQKHPEPDNWVGWYSE